MTITWTSENYVKLLAALLAAHPEFKPNYQNIAIYFGNGATYDAIQGCMRPIRRKADQLREEFRTGVRPNVPAKPTPRKRSAPAASTAKGKRGFTREEEVDDEEVLTPTKKRARTVEGGTPRTPIKSEKGGRTGRNGKGSATASTVIDIIDLDEEPVLSDVKVKREVNSVVVKSESGLFRDQYHSESEDSYME